MPTLNGQDPVPTFSASILHLLATPQIPVFTSQLSSDTHIYICLKSHPSETSPIVCWPIFRNKKKNFQQNCHCVRYNRRSHRRSTESEMKNKFTQYVHQAVSDRCCCSARSLANEASCSSCNSSCNHHHDFY